MGVSYPCYPIHYAVYAGMTLCRYIHACNNMVSSISGLGINEAIAYNMGCMLLNSSITTPDFFEVAMLMDSCICCWKVEPLGKE